MEKVFKEIGKLMKDNRSSAFQIISYRYLEIYVKLIYRDCNEYFVAHYDSKKMDGSYLPLERLGFSKDRDIIGEEKSFRSLYEVIEEEVSNIDKSQELK